MPVEQGFRGFSPISTDARSGQARNGRFGGPSIAQPAEIPRRQRGCLVGETMAGRLTLDDGGRPPAASYCRVRIWLSTDSIRQRAPSGQNVPEAAALGHRRCHGPSFQRLNMNNTGIRHVGSGCKHAGAQRLAPAVVRRPPLAFGASSRARFALAVARSGWPRLCLRPKWCIIKDGGGENDTLDY